MKYITSDIESNNWINFLMIGLYDGTNYKIFDSLTKYLNYIEKNYSGYRVYFHNGGKFDFLFLFELLNERGEIDIIERGGSIIQIRYKYLKGRITFCDSYPLLPASLDSLIKTYKVKHKKIPINFNVKHNFNNKKLQQHLENDCKALYNIIEQTENVNNCLPLTIASLAMKVFTNDFFNGFIWQSSDKFDNYFRKNYYRGGRVEVLKGYGKNLYYYDVNSLYPFVMLNKMPVGKPIRTKRYMSEKIGFYKIELLSNTKFIISPLIKRVKKSNYYVNGIKGEIFYLISPELKILISKKIKFKILDGYYFKQSEFLFNDYVNTYYKIKSTTKDEVQRYFSKLMLNSLYGKFGQQLKGEKIESYKNQTDFKVFDAFNDLVLVSADRNIKFKGVYLASYITSLARAYHYNLMDNIGMKNIFYCDTDSIICNKKIITSNKIGGLKLENRIKEGVFISPKTYGIKLYSNKSIVHFKGFKSNSFTFNDLKKLLNKQVNELEQTGVKMLGFRSSQSRKNNILKSAGNYLKLVNDRKILRFNYEKRVIIKDKKHVFITKPFNVDNINNNT